MAEAFQKQQRMGVTRNQKEVIFLFNNSRLKKKDQNI